jgi:hypothetical protein
MWKHEENELFFVIRNNEAGGTIAFSDEKAEGSKSKKIVRE